MYIGEIAKKTQLSVKAIRLYEDKGLLVPLPRKGSYRVYDNTHIEILNLIKEAKLLGATLAQLQSVIVYKNGDINWQRIEDFLTEMKSQLAQQVTELKSKINKIEACLLEIDACPKKH